MPHACQLFRKRHNTQQHGDIAACCAIQVRYVGEREVPERMSTEHLRTEERVVEETVTSPCSPLECNGCVPTTRGVAGNGVSSALPYRCFCLSALKIYWVPANDLPVFWRALKLNRLVPHRLYNAAKNVALIRRPSPPLVDTSML